MNTVLETSLTIVACCAAIVAPLMTVAFVKAAAEGFRDWWKY